MAQQTAVEWLVKEFGLESYKASVWLALGKEKQQIKQAFIDGDGGYSPDNGNVERMADDYYKINYDRAADTE